MSHDTTEPSRRYHFFILGIWAQPGSRPDEPHSWRLSLENPHTSERSSFKTLMELNAFLYAWMDEKTGNTGDAHEQLSEPSKY